SECRRTTASRSVPRDRATNRSRAAPAAWVRSSATSTRLMRRALRITGGALVVAGVLTLAWAVVIWRWQDPFTALYTHWQQGKLASSLDHQFAEYHPIHVDSTDFIAEKRAISADARAYRANATQGQAIGRIVIMRIGLNMVVVNGTDEGSLKKGPGRDLR